MQFEVQCTCGKRMLARTEHVGKRAKCSACGQTFLVEAPQEPSGQATSQDPALDAFLGSQDQGMQQAPPPPGLGAGAGAGFGQAAPTGFADQAAPTGFAGQGSQHPDLPQPQPYPPQGVPPQGFTPQGYGPQAANPYATPQPYPTQPYGAQPYGAQPYMPDYMRRAHLGQHRGMAQTSFWLSLVGFIICGPLAWIGLIMAIVTLVKMNSTKDTDGQGWAVAGLILGGLQVLFAIFFIMMMAAGDM